MTDVARKEVAMALQAAEANGLESQANSSGEILSYAALADAAVTAHLEALGAGGYVVVKLPEPDPVQAETEMENGYRQYALGDVVAFNDGEVHVFGKVWQLSDVEVLAAALLAAAADASEAS